MHIQFDVDYVNHYSFLPVYGLDARLIAVEIVNRFHNESNKLSMPQEFLSGTLSQRQRKTLLKEQLTILKSKSSWFIDNKINAQLKIDYSLAEIFVEDDALNEDFQSLPFLHLEMNETVSDISRGGDFSYLYKLGHDFPLWLDNFGSGKMNLKPFYDGIIHGVKMDVRFVGKLLARPTSVSIINPMLRVMRRHCPDLKVVAKGIDDKSFLEKAFEIEVNAVQGNLWPAFSQETLDLPLSISRHKQGVPC
ncbi:EAL domain-containing protein [Musicola keenii]|uniref:EAL domain-containing protein n=1 Tax=Musicola keenii TaxID=2884250 RepID=UPI0017871539|nr:EAL domain-containing protein [Musicola keenii]